jgi:hypothetical protein
MLRNGSKPYQLASLNDIASFHQSFLNRWEVKKNPLQILSEYESIKRNQGESVQDYCTRFNNIYNAIPTNIKPPQGLALIKFPDGFDADMSYQLRERNPATLEEMQKCVVSVEANLLAKRARQRTERRVTIKEEPSTSTVDAKIDSLVRTMERMMEILEITDRNPPRENQPGPQIRNPNFRRNPPQIRQREPREQREQRGPDQQIRPPFQENYVDEGEETIEGLDDVHINLMGINDNDSIFLTQEEHDLFLLSQTEVDEEESEQQAFENAIMEVHRKYNLRSKKSNDNPTKKASDFKKTSDTPAKKVPEKKNSEVPTKRTSDSVPKTTQTDVPSTSQPKDTTQKNVVEKSDLPNQNKTPTSFSLESELAKLKIPIPLS